MRRWECRSRKGGRGEPAPRSGHPSSPGGGWSKVRGGEGVYRWVCKLTSPRNWRNKFFPAVWVGLAMFINGLVSETPENYRACCECGCQFVIPENRGRPPKFCSPLCRLVSKRRQIKEWGVSGAEKADTVTCRQCLAGFALPTRSRGRLPHFCSPRCRTASLRGPQPGRLGHDIQTDLFALSGSTSTMSAMPLLKESQ